MTCFPTVPRLFHHISVRWMQLFPASNAQALLQGLLWKHLSLILHGIKALMHAAPRILTNAAFHLAVPLCFYKDVCCRISKYTHSSQNCPQSQHSLLTQHHIIHDMDNYVSAELENTEHQTLRVYVMEGSALCLTTQRQNHMIPEKLPFVTSVFTWAAETVKQTATKGVSHVVSTLAYVLASTLVIIPGENSHYVLNYEAMRSMQKREPRLSSDGVFILFSFCNFVLSCNMPSLVSTCLIKYVFMLYCMFLASSSKCQNHFQSIAVDVVPYSASSLSCMEFYDDWFVDFVVGRRLCNTQEHDVSG